MPAMKADRAHLDIAIVGGGIIGLVVALGLLKRNIGVKIYEQARSFREIGAGVAFTANAIRCMSLIDPQIVDAVNNVATPNGDPDNPNDYLQWIDGYHYDPKDPEGTEGKLLFNLYAGYKGFQGCHRAHLLDELVKHIPQGVVEFGHRFTGYVERGHEEKLLLQFHDGTTAEADAVIACDGIKSRVRQLILGEDNPASYPHFSHKVAFRGLAPIEEAERVLGSFKARNQHMHIGPGAHMLHFPVANQTLLNIVAFLNEPNDWPLDGGKAMTAPATREEVIGAFANWGPTVRSVANLLPEELDKWAIFDAYDYPASTYTQGRVCLAGDAAHASAPHHGAGAGIGVEDALALSTLLEMVTSTLQSTEESKERALNAAFAIYNSVRHERSQWLVKSSREVCDIYEWNHPDTGTDWDKCLAEITARSHKLWYFDIEGMLSELTDTYQRQYPPQVTAVEKGMESSIKSQPIQSMS